MQPPSLDVLVVTARQLARGGDWARVVEALEPNDIDARSELLLLLAEGYLRTGQPEKGRSWLDRVIPIVDRHSDRGALRKATNMAGAAAYELGDLADAEAAWERALALAEADDDVLLIARAHNNLGILANIRGHRDRALGLYRRAVPAYQQLGSPTGLAESFHNMAITHRDRQEWEHADERERQAVEYAKEAGNDRLVSLARLGQAEIAFRRGDHQLAGATARLVADEFAKMSDPLRHADALRLSSLAYLMAGDVARAEKEAMQGLVLAKKHGGALVEGETLAALAEIVFARGDRAIARARATEALNAFQRLGATEEVARMLAWIARMD